jgi:hypothetical protein
MLDGLRQGLVRHRLTDHDRVITTPVLSGLHHEYPPREAAA